MRNRRGAVPLWAVAALALAASACGGAPEEDAEVRGDAYEGLTPAQIERQAEAMSPEQAAELGIVDTTIHVEQLTSPEDSAIIRDSVPVPQGDTTR